MSEINALDEILKTLTEQDTVYNEPSLDRLHLAVIALIKLLIEREKGETRKGASGGAE